MSDAEEPGAATGHGDPKPKHFNWRPRTIRTRLPSALYTPEEFEHLIELECAKADRYKTRFSLAVFEIGDGDENTVLVRRLVRTLHHRFRNTDEIGWNSDRQIGVVFPFTQGDSARKLAEYVCEMLASVIAPPAFTIYTYPSEGWPHRRRRRLARYLHPFRYRNRFGLGRPPRIAEFHAFIARERNRADRNNNVFSLLIFDLAPAEFDGETVRRLAGVLFRRLRDTDELGWFDERHLGVLLPYSNGEDAARFGASVCKAAGLSDHSRIGIHTYPDSWFPPSSPLASRFRATRLAPDAMRSDASRARMVALVYPSQPAWKRGMDIVGASLSLAVASPALLLSALWIKLVSPGPVFFRQIRVGCMGAPFEMMKLRTMQIDAEFRTHSQHVRKLIAEGGGNTPMVKLEHLPHIIPGGRVIRSLCIDEIPQLINVLRGEMSLVGPRPCVPYEAEEYRRWHARRFDSVPGMTGLWQVSGKNRTTFKEMIRLDIKYEQARSPWFDLQILFMTPIAIVRQLLERPQPAGQAVPAGEAEPSARRNP